MPVFCPGGITWHLLPGSWWVIGDLLPAAEEDRVDDWQMAKPRRQQQKPRGNGVAAPEQPQQEQTNGHSQAPAPSLPQPQPREEVASQGPPQQSPRPAAAPYSRGVPAGAMGDQGTATKRPLSTMGCLKCQDPSHKCAHRARLCSALICRQCFLPCLAIKKCRTA